MSKHRNKNNSSLAPLAKPTAKTFVIPKFNSPQSLDDYFSDLKLEVHACLKFLKTTSDKTPTLEKLLVSYSSLKENLNLSFDLLVHKAKVEPGDFRRLILSTLDYLSTDRADVLIKLTKPLLVETSLKVALDETHPDSQTERQGWLEYAGYRPVSKNQQLVNVNITPTQNTNIQQNVVNGLPSFSSTLEQSEKLGSKTMKELNPSKDLPIDLDVIDITTKEKELVEK